MKKLTITLALIIVSLLAYAQPYLEMHGNSLGYGAGVGYLAPNSGFQLAGGYNYPAKSSEDPRIIDFTLGKRFCLSDRYEGDFNLTIAAGVADYRRTVYTEY